MQRELERQRWLLQQLFAPAGTGTGTSAAADQAHWLSHPRVPAQRGLQAYRGNAAAVAERALAAAYPTVVQMLGAEPFAAVARALWLAHPPTQGDLATWGCELPDFLAALPELAAWPYLPDSARLDAALAHAERAADEAFDAASLTLLSEADPAQLWLDLAPGTTVLPSAHPVVTLWAAHQALPCDPEALNPAREAVAQGQSECALVWRHGWRAQAAAISPATARWTQALLRGDAIELALNAAGEAFAFEAWLVSVLQHGGLVRVRQGLV